ncbi:MAG: DUF2723 domain-containing protein [Anaerolineae bacterium]|nr:DUF2723 domain-containing protein [Anaerolineae bacterium]
MVHKLRRLSLDLDCAAALGVGIIGLVLYYRTLAPSVLMSDAGEYQFVLTELGIAHPTGYPLYTILGHLWSFLPIRTPAYRANLLSAVAGAATLSVLYLAFRQVSGRKALAAASALWMAVAPTFWSQMTVAGSYSLNALLFALFLYAVLRRLNGDWGVKPAVLAYGVGLTHHRTMVLATPALAYLLWLERHNLRRWRYLAGLAALVVLPNLIWLYIPIRAHQLGRSDLATLKGLADFLLGTTFSRYWLMGGWKGLLQQFGNWRNLHVGEFGWPALALAAGGLLVGFARRRRLVVSTFLVYLAHLAFNLNYRIGNIWMYYIPSYMLVLLWAVLFLDQLVAYLERHVPHPGWIRVGASGAIATAIAYTAVAGMMARYPALDRSHDYWLEDYWLDALASPLEERAVVFSDWNMHTPLVYFQRICGLRRDIQPRILTEEAVAEALNRNEVVYVTNLPSQADSLVVSGMGPLFELRRQVRALRDTPVGHSLSVDFGPCLTLRGYDFRFLRRDRGGGRRYLVALYWSRPGTGACDPGITVRLFSGESQVGQVDGRLVRGVYPVERWRFGEVVVDHHILVLPPDLHLPQKADLLVGVYDPNTLELVRTEGEDGHLVRLASVSLEGN